MASGSHPECWHAVPRPLDVAAPPTDPDCPNCGAERAHALVVSVPKGIRSPDGGDHVADRKSLLIVDC